MRRLTKQERQKLTTKLQREHNSGAKLKQQIHHMQYITGSSKCQFCTAELTEENTKAPDFDIEFKLADGTTAKRVQLK